MIKMTRCDNVETAIYDLETQLRMVLLKKCRKKRMKCLLTTPKIIFTLDIYRRYIMRKINTFYTVCQPTSHST